MTEAQCNQVQRKLFIVLMTGLTLFSIAVILKLIILMYS